MASCEHCQTPLEPWALSCPACTAPIHRDAESFVSGSVADLGWGRAIVGDRIGDGGMGAVYRGWLYYNPNGPRAGAAPHEIAIKVLHPELTSRAYVRKLFAGEAEALALLSHPNIVRLFGMCERASQMALVLELVDGEPLDAVILRHVERSRPGGLPAMPFLRAWHYMQQLLGALAATHALGIVHRDVKPANVLIRRDGFVKLTDFGIARLPSDGKGVAVGMQPGTGAYMSPEQVLGQPLDGRSDLYSAGIVLYEMLTGRTPFERPERNELATRAAQVDEAPTPVTQCVPSAPHVLDVLMARALAKNPAHRFPTAIAFGDAFRAALGVSASFGWEAQQAMARDAAGIVGPGKGRGSTVKIAQVDADRMRQAIAGAYGA